MRKRQLTRGYFASCRTPLRSSHSGRARTRDCTIQRVGAKSEVCCFATRDSINRHNVTRVRSSLDEVAPSRLIRVARDLELLTINFAALPADAAETDRIVRTCTRIERGRERERETTKHMYKMRERVQRTRFIIVFLLLVATLLHAIINDGNEPSACLYRFDPDASRCTTEIPSRHVYTRCTPFSSENGVASGNEKDR